MSSAHVWAALRALCYSLWVCRVSVLSVVGGFLLFLLASQAQAVFLDLHTVDVSRWHWPAFYGSLLLFWMLPVQLGARVMLHAGQDRVHEEDASWFAYFMVHLPWVLALFCLVGVAVGQYLAMEHIPSGPKGPRSPLDEAAYAQARVLLWTTLALIALWLAAWVVLPPIMHRLTVGRGLLDIGILRFIATALFGRRARTRGYGLDAGPDGALRLSPEQLQSAAATVSLAAILIVSIVLVFRSPLEIWPSLSRAPMFAVLVGAWLPFLTPFAYAAHRFRLPVLAAFVLLMTFVANWMTGLHDMRVTVQTAETGPLEVRQPTLEEALSWWRKANGCEEKLRQPCSVRPIIVAGEGGASRAGFFTGSLLAQLEDLSDPAKAGSDTPVFSNQLFAVSTVSGSTLGAAVFAALREDSQGEAWTRPAPEPAGSALWFRSGKAWGVGGIPPEPLPRVASRKDILQQILAGDFLTPVIAALSLDIWVPWHARFHNRGDRAYFLEQSWEHRFADPSGVTRKAKAGFDRPFVKLAPQQDRWRPILIFNGTSITTGRRIVTSTLYPLMVSPDVSPDRVTEDDIESVFRSSYDIYDLMCVHDKAPGKGSCACEQRAPGKLQPLRVKGCDIPLSTAVSNSARFPIISPHGDVVSGGKVVDRIADGGYFDYSGIVSALELRAQIARVDNELKPFVLFVTNDPGFNPRACETQNPPDELDVLRTPAVPPAAAISSKLFSILAYPIDALLAGRISRAEQTMANAVLLNRQDNIKTFKFERAPRQLALLRTTGRQSYISFDIVSVGASCNNDKQIRPVPMNWWLAMPTQAYLDSELCADHNQETIAGVLSQLGPQPGDDDEVAHLSRFLKAKARVARVCSGPGRLFRSRQVR